MEFNALDKSACGVGFIVSRKSVHSHDHLQAGLQALRCVEHRGACSADQITGDGAGVMTDIPWELFGYEPDSVAVATLFTPSSPHRKRQSLKVFEETFKFFGLEVVGYRDTPINREVLGEEARENMPDILHAFIKRPHHCRTDYSFDKLLFTAKQRTRIKEKEAGINKEFFFASLSAKTIVYKALTKSNALDQFYLDLQNPRYKTRFTLFHRRFSTNTKTSWDKIQPFRLIGHNGEINTIAGNRSWSISREKSLGVQKDEMLTRGGISDSGSLNEMAEGLRYHSGIPNVEDSLAIMMPPADQTNEFYNFWSRSVEPWDGPAFITYSEGNMIGARLDRNGFRPCRWAMTDDHFYLSSEAGTFELNESNVLSKGSLHAGNGVSVDINTGEAFFRDPSHSKENIDSKFDARLVDIEERDIEPLNDAIYKMHLFNYTNEDLKEILQPMITEAKEPIGSMGDTARLAVFSDEPRPLFDYFYQNFAQVTNPPLDYIREQMVTDLSVYLGKKPNVFEPKELIPIAPAYKLKSPVLSLKEMEFIRSLKEDEKGDRRIRAIELETTFSRIHGTIGLKETLKAIGQKAVKAAENGIAVIILSDRKSSYENPAIPSLIALRSVINSLNSAGVRLESSVVVDTAQIRSTHHAATLLGFGATAICPYLSLDYARHSDDRKLNKIEANTREQNLIKAYESGILKIMAKTGISVLRSYQSAKLFTAVGLGKQLVKDYFPGISSPIGGLELEQVTERILDATKHMEEAEDLGSKMPKSYRFKEHTRGKKGEKHSMTNTRSKMIHNLVRKGPFNLDNVELFDEYLKEGGQDEPLNVRHLFQLKEAEQSLELDDIEPKETIMKRFGSGAMSFGAISDKSQRDIFTAMRKIGGRSNSGEGGENPYYYVEGVSASTKQVASGRFGVTAEYLVSGEEVQIKIAQGAKPGEGGQLMGLKVDEQIAHARHANPGVDLISPPPLHDIYSIEDLKQLIYELKQLKPGIPVGVKLVSGANIGTVAVGVAKAGADVIHVSGGDGGTGAASVSSMCHAGLAWELGLFEVHQTLISNNLRKNVKLRTDGGLSTGTDLVIASMLGADEFDFGKLFLIAEGCVMARICEKNTCPTGIATHNPKFKKKYKGKEEDVIRLCEYLAEDVRRQLSKVGKRSLDDVMGRHDLLTVNENAADIIKENNLDLGYFFDTPVTTEFKITDRFDEGVNNLNTRLVHEIKPKIESNEDYEDTFDIFSVDRAIPATLSGYLAKRISEHRLGNILEKEDLKKPYDGTIQLTFNGSAGQGFGVFTVDGMNLKLFGEANDSVCKAMSGGKVVITPPLNAQYKAHEATIIGNCSLYGATGGTLYVHGLAGDRFAVRNSGATAVVEGVGLHACEYMTNGKIVILGDTYYNIGAGMTGGELITFGDPGEYINSEYIGETKLTDDEYQELYVLLDKYHRETGSTKANYILKDWDEAKENFHLYRPVGLLDSKEEEIVETES
jgi:glutamate synthase domain-containing protein 2/glutamate synthase domain-containing protein 1/glutamate synthase domain-containing protein 3